MILYLILLLKPTGSFEITKIFIKVLVFLSFLCIMKYAK